MTSAGRDPLRRPPRRELRPLPKPHLVENDWTPARALVASSRPSEPMSRSQNHEGLIQLLAAMAREALEYERSQPEEVE